VQLLEVRLESIRLRAGLMHELMGGFRQGLQVRPSPCSCAWVRLKSERDDAAHLAGCSRRQARDIGDQLHEVLRGLLGLLP
jgi:hypothetical protein